MRYLSICSGIEAATVAWHPLGWEAAAFAEIDPFARAVLAHHYPAVPLHGDFTTIKDGDYGAIDLLVGGTPCQSFSIAGLRKGLDDDRGNLTLEYIRLAERLRPRWLVWENVPGVLSIDGGRTFGAFLGGLAECGYGFAYRILDAQYFGVPQRRRRVFVVGYLGDWRPPAAVFLEPEGLRGYYGTYHQMSKKHLQRYVNEFIYRFNAREEKPYEVFDSVVANIANLDTLPYKTLTRAA
jgi:DNA (cytosine-5)-methyltransferase 1